MKNHLFLGLTIYLLLSLTSNAFAQQILESRTWNAGKKGTGYELTIDTEGALSGWISINFFGKNKKFLANTRNLIFCPAYLGPVKVKGIIPNKHINPTEVSVSFIK